MNSRIISPLLYPLLGLLVAIGFMIGQRERGKGIPASVSQKGHQLKIESDPVGATAFLNARLLGSTPLHLAGMKDGDYVLRLEKDGYLPWKTRFQVFGNDREVTAALKTVPIGRLVVEVLPQGSEVLLDGQLVGLTPLTLNKISIANYELTIRKTNFEAHVQRVTVLAGKTVRVKDFELFDKVLAMLRAQIAAEPTRVAHYSALGHYLFVNDQLREAAQIYSDAIVIAATPLVFNDTVAAEEQMLQRRLRGQDVRLINDQLRKKKHYAGKDVSLFRATIEKAQDRVAQNHVESWEWVHQAAKNMIKDRKLERAEKLYLRHIKTVLQKQNLAQAYTELMAVRLKMHNLSAVKETFHLFVERYQQRADLLRQAANRIYGIHNAYRGEERIEVLGMAEKLLTTALKTTKHAELKALCTFEWANVLTLQGRYKEAITRYEESITGTKEQSTRELRSMKKASCHMKIHSYLEARTIYTDLLKSPRVSTQRMAEQGLQALAIHEKKR